MKQSEALSTLESVSFPYVNIYRRSQTLETIARHWNKTTKLAEAHVAEEVIAAFPDVFEIIFHPCFFLILRDIRPFYM